VTRVNKMADQRIGDNQTISNDETTFKMKASNVRTSKTRKNL
jgi:hypothetical protein